jgi:hypothetical protein
VSLPHRIRPQADEEIGFEVSFYEARRPGLGWELFDAVRAAISRATDVPAACGQLRSPAGMTIRFAPVGGFPFKVVFLHEPEELVILALAHDRRRPGYWRTRL